MSERCECCHDEITAGGDPVCEDCQSAERRTIYEHAEARNLSVTVQVDPGPAMKIIEAARRELETSLDTSRQLMMRLNAERERRLRLQDEVSTLRARLAHVTETNEDC